jgi:hypothetical protein
MQLTKARARDLRLRTLKRFGMPDQLNVSDDHSFLESLLKTRKIRPMVLNKNFKSFKQEQGRF